VTALLVMAGAGIGATLRFVVAHHLDGRFPRGTLAVNVVGAFVIGVVSGVSPSADAVALLGTGFCGGLTTYSAFAVQTVEQATQRGPRLGAAYALLTVALALGACACGVVIGQA
jgi:fluoride exporter